MDPPREMNPGLPLQPLGEHLQDKFHGICLAWQHGLPGWKPCLAHNGSVAISVGSEKTLEQGAP